MTSLERYHSKRDRGLCVQCGKPFEDTTRTRCPACRAYHAAEQRARKKIRRQLGKCLNCAADAIPGQVFCPDCAAKNRIRVKEYRKRKQAERREAKNGRD